LTTKHDLTTIFTRIYKTRRWAKKAETPVSGTGSSLSETENLRDMLPSLFGALTINSVLDIPCGDFTWMQTVEMHGMQYIGADIVPELVAINVERHSDDNHSFYVMDVLSDDLPKVDLIICRDCLVHFCEEDIKTALKNIKRSGSKYLATTIYTEKEKNNTIRTGQWRSLNLLIEPFLFPEPITCIVEGCPTPGFEDKSLAVWEIKDIPDYDDV
jgi:SAM-dependent methyltransferase